MRVFLFRIFILGHLVYGSTVYAQDGKLDALKAAFIYNFVQFITWEDHASKSEIVIGVVGDSLMLESLKSLAVRKNSKYKITVKDCKEIKNITNCDILFYSSSGDKRKLSSVYYELAKEEHILIVSDFEFFIPKGVAINFVVRDNNLKFIIDQKALKACGLKASSQLLKLSASK